MRFGTARSGLWLALVLTLTAAITAGPATAGDVSRTIHVPDGWEGAYEFGYAPVVRVGDWVIVSGVAAGGEGTYEEKIRGMYTRARDLLKEAGATIDDVVELTTFHLQPKGAADFRAEFDVYMPIHREFFGEHRPAWTAVGTSALLSRTAPVEMRVVAVVGSGKDSRVVRGSKDGDAYGERLGTVVLPVSCDEQAARLVERGLALMHHMTYDASLDAFAHAAEADPDCAMAYWGQAMTHIHPLWSDPPKGDAFEHGKAMADKAADVAVAQGATEREKAYIAAVRAYYAEGPSPDERGALARFAAGWEEVHKAYPDDVEAAALYALTHLSTADPGDKTFATQKRSGAIAEDILERIPDHPGAHHYLIHAYDVPPLAEQALDVARHYGEVAPAVPHALHMPTHIFTRRGLWDEAITWNRRSADAALAHPMGGHISLHYLHALDYLAYAHLQRAEDRKAEEVLDTLRGLEGPLMVEVATPYTLAAVPARLALERQRWAEAARIEPRTPADYPWDRFPAMEAISHFARALGAARSGDAKTARQALDRMAELKEQAGKSSPYWAKQVEVQWLAAKAWLEYEQGKRAEGLATMRHAAEVEASTEKHPVTPGEVLPARELLGDMLLEMGHAKEAKAAYEATLERSPNRFNSFYGAARAAEMAGNEEEAKAYYRKLVELAAGADSPRERLDKAKAYLAGTHASK